MSELPAEVQSWIGQERYEEETEFDVERGYILTSCSSVQNGNLLFWDEKTAQDLAGGMSTKRSRNGYPAFWLPRMANSALAKR